MRPKTDILTLKLYPRHDSKHIRELDKKMASISAERREGYYWLISSKEQINECLIEYTLTKPCQTLAEWELEHKPSITTKEEAERLLHGSGGKKTIWPD